LIHQSGDEFLTSIRARHRAVPAVCCAPGQQTNSDGRESQGYHLEGLLALRLPKGTFPVRGQPTDDSAKVVDSIKADVTRALVGPEPSGQQEPTVVVDEFSDLLFVVATHVQHARLRQWLVVNDRRPHQLFISVEGQGPGLVTEGTRLVQTDDHGAFDAPASKRIYSEFVVVPSVEAESRIRIRGSYVVDAVGLQHCEFDVLLERDGNGAIHDQKGNSYRVRARILD